MLYLIFLYTSSSADNTPVYYLEYDLDKIYSFSVILNISLSKIKVLSLASSPNSSPNKFVNLFKSSSIRALIIANEYLFLSLAFKTYSSGSILVFYDISVKVSSKICEKSIFIVSHNILS